MPKPPVDELELIGGEVCLDLANTVDPRFGEPRDDYLASYRELVAWAAHARILSASEAERLVALGDRHPTQAERVRSRAVSLREAVYALFAPGSGRTEDGLAVLNEELRAAAAHAVLVPAADAYARVYRSGDGLDPMLWPCAQSAAELLLAPARRARTGECDGEDCGWLYVDTSKAGRRRWCSMRSCGNRAKAQRYRARR